MSALFHGDDYREVGGTSPINVNDLAEIVGKFKNLQNDVGLHVVLELKKTEAAKNLIVSLNICSDGNHKHIICQDEWTEVPIGQIYHGKGTFHSGRSNVALYTAEINITIHATIPVAPITNHKLYEDTELIDFNLQAQDGVVAFHKSVLFIQSEWFRTKLRGQWKKTREVSIDLPGVSVQTLQHLKDFMYLGTVPDEGLELLLLIARHCLMDNLVAACIDKLIKMVKPETFDDLAAFACQNNIIELVRAFARIPDHVVNGIRWYN